MHKSNATPAPIIKGGSFGQFQCAKNQYEIDKMKAVPYTSAVGSLQYAQVCTRPDLAFITGVLSRYQANPGIEHWKLVKKTLCYAQGTKDLMLTYRRSDFLEIRGYSNVDYAGDQDDRKVHVGIRVYSRRMGYFVEKLQTVDSCIIHDVCRIIACFEATRQAIWLKKYTPELKVVDCIGKPLKMYCDN
jgi:hypothetical protein